MEQLLAMGFPAEAARSALAASNQNIRLAVAQLTGDDHPSEPPPGETLPLPHSDTGLAVGTATVDPPAAPATELDAQESTGGGQLRRWFSDLLGPSRHGPVYLLASSHGASAAITPRGQMYEVPPSAQVPAGGRGQALTLGPKESGLLFSFDGNISSGASIRINDDPALALEVNWRKYEVGNAVSLWASGDTSHAAWAQHFALNNDGTLSPVGRLVGPAVPRGLVLGVAQQGSQLILVRQDDITRRIVFASADVMTKAVADLAQQQRLATARLEAQARAICTDALKADLRDNGFVHVPQAVSSALIRRAKQEINRAIGASTGSADAFKAKTFASEPAIVDLFNRSVLPLLCRELLGNVDARGSASGASAHYKQHVGQLALRFPGDLCESDGCECSPEHFEHVRRNWHIDGLPSDFIPGKTDHYGTIHNFDMLCGVLLSDIDEPLSGELCCYKGSHSRLAKHIAETGLDRLYAKGNAALPTGPQTDVLFGSQAHEQVHHCVGKAGDAFLANYMAAHFVAPNTSADIRYAVYFRVHGLAFDRENPVHQSASMINPWIHWFGLNGLSTGDARAIVAAGRGQGGATSLAAAADIDFHMSADNVAASSMAQHSR